MDDATVSILGRLLCLAGLLSTFAFAGTVFIAGTRSGSQHKRFRYVLLGGIFAFLSGVSISTSMLVPNPDLRALPILFLLSLACGVGGAFFVYYNIWSTSWASKWLERHKNRLAGGEAERDE
jgi:hypothetical protein